ncbi:unnamed protein product [Gongylonema pulchrum]|uniref:Btz domain-containing protein n=1 Tax=Gongylonema pulchrum TaxID=637853 RepID=A0A183DN18_9BILA|nr:unnamed protein product [Gongylonema pulchrum]
MAGDADQPPISSLQLRPALKKAADKQQKNPDTKPKHIRHDCIRRPAETEQGVGKSAPARLSQKKKTVAFGSTINVSQTVEVEQLDTKMLEIQEKIVELTRKDVERSDQFLKLTEMVKKLMENGAKCNFLSDSKEEDGGKRKSLVGRKKQFRDKENVSPRRDKSATKSLCDVKWETVKRKYMENEEFKRLVDEALMKYGGDQSLDVVAGKQCKRDSMRAQSHQHEQTLRHVSSSPVIRSTTLVTKQMTVEQIRKCDNSPSRDAAFSYDSKKYLARHGIISALDDDDGDDDESVCGAVFAKRSELPLSDYQPGNSMTYYSKREKCNSRAATLWPSLPRNYGAGHDYGKERQFNGGKRLPGIAMNDVFYQIDHFDTDEGESVNDIIEISDDSEDGEPPRTANAAKIQSFREIRAWRGNTLRTWSIVLGSFFYPEVRESSYWPPF